MRVKAEHREPLRERDLRWPRVAADAEIAHQPHHLPFGEREPQGITRALTPRPERPQHELAVRLRLARPHERRIAAVDSEQHALDRRRRAKVLAPQRTHDLHLEPRLRQ